MARAFLSHKREAQSAYLGDYLDRLLSGRGRRSFLDKRIEDGKDWGAVIGSELRADLQELASARPAGPWLRRR